MPVGGRREGAGRKKGSLNKISAVQRARNLLHGDAPLDVLLRVMRYFGKVFDKLSAEVDLAESLPADTPADAVKAKAQREAKLKEIAQLLADFANKAAPFVHSRLATIDNTPRIDPSKLSSRGDRDCRPNP